MDFDVIYQLPIRYLRKMVYSGTVHQLFIIFNTAYLLQSVLIEFINV
jgi:hypothetical protein